MCCVLRWEPLAGCWEAGEVPGVFAAKFPLCLPSCMPFFLQAESLRLCGDELIAVPTPLTEGDKQPLPSSSPEPAPL